jgi:hypothetical protein
MLPAMAKRWARVWFGSTALVVLVAMVMEVIVTVTFKGGPFTSVGDRVFNMVFYFTIESNLLVGVTSLLLAIRLDRPSVTFRVFRLAAIVGITITALVYHAVLAQLVHPTGLWFVADQFVHTIVPFLAITGWLVFGPRAHTSWPVTLLMLLYPAFYLVITLIRGPLVNWYPYPFVDAAKLGYLHVLFNSVGLAVLFLAFAGGATLLDRWLVRRGRARLDAVVASATAEPVNTPQQVPGARSPCDSVMPRR